MVSNMHMQVLHAVVNGYTAVETVRANSFTSKLIFEHTFTTNASIQACWLTRAGPGWVARRCLIAITPPSVWWETGNHRPRYTQASRQGAGGSDPPLGGFHLESCSVIDYNWMKL